MLSGNNYIRPHSPVEPMILHARKDLDKRYTIVDLWHMAKGDVENVERGPRFDLVSDVCPDQYSFADIGICADEIVCDVAESLGKLRLYEFKTERQLLNTYPLKVQDWQNIQPKPKRKVVKKVPELV